MFPCVAPHYFLSNAVTDFQLIPFAICYSVLLFAHLLSSIWAMPSVYFRFAFVAYSATSVTLFFSLPLMMMFRILPFSLTFGIFLTIARWLFSSFFTLCLVRGNVWHLRAIACKAHQLKTLLFRLIGRCFSRKISLYFPQTTHPAFHLINTF